MLSAGYAAFALLVRLDTPRHEAGTASPRMSSPLLQIMEPPVLDAFRNGEGRRHFPLTDETPERVSFLASNNYVFGKGFQGFEHLRKLPPGYSTV